MCIVKVPSDDQVKRIRLEELERVIGEKWEAVKSVDATPLRCDLPKVE